MLKGQCPICGPLVASPLTPQGGAAVIASIAVAASCLVSHLPSLGSHLHQAAWSRSCLGTFPPFQRLLISLVENPGSALLYNLWAWFKQNSSFWVPIQTLLRMSRRGQYSIVPGAVLL